jgi:hypothetical protein
MITIRSAEMILALNKVRLTGSAYYIGNKLGL